MIRNLNSTSAPPGLEILAIVADLKLVAIVKAQGAGAGSGATIAWGPQPAAAGAFVDAPDPDVLGDSDG